METLQHSREDYIEKFSDLPTIFGKVTSSLHKAYERNAKTYNLRKREMRFSVGDLVWRRNKVLSNAANYFTAKLAPKYVLNKVSRVHSSLVYTLEDLANNSQGKWHVEHLKPYLGEEVED